MHAIVLGKYLIRFVAVKVDLKINQLLVALVDFQLKSSNLKRLVMFANYEASLLLYRGMCNLHPLLKLNASSAFRGKQCHQKSAK